MNDVSAGIVISVIFVAVVTIVLVVGFTIERIYIRHDVNLCGHTLECFEHVVFGKDKSK